MLRMSCFYILGRACRHSPVVGGAWPPGYHRVLLLHAPVGAFPSGSPLWRPEIARAQARGWSCLKIGRERR